MTDACNALFFHVTRPTLRRELHNIEQDVNRSACLEMSLSRIRHFVYILRKPIILVHGHARESTGPALVNFKPVHGSGPQHPATHGNTTVGLKIPLDHPAYFTKLQNKDCPRNHCAYEDLFIKSLYVIGLL